MTFMRRKFLIRILIGKSLKTKGFSRKTEALIRIGGGENRTLVLGKLHIDHYMLSVLVRAPLDVEHTTKRGLLHLVSILAP